MTLYKYPKTLHLPWSSGLTGGDKVVPDVSVFYGKFVVATEKLDGENTTMTPERCHARSLDSNNHLSRNWVKGLWGQIHSRQAERTGDRDER